MFSITAFQKKEKFGYYMRFPLFLFLEGNLCALFVLHKKGIQIKFFFSNSSFINLEEKNVDALKRIYFHMINYNKKKFLKEFIKGCY